MPRDRESLLDILEAARLARQYLEGRTREQFLADVQLQDAVIRRLEIMGEAARRASDEAREQCPTLPWADMVAMRNIMIHQYDHVDMALVWDAVQQDLPRVVAALEALFPPEPA